MSELEQDQGQDRQKPKPKHTLIRLHVYRMPGLVRRQHLWDVVRTEERLVLSIAPAVARIASALQFSMQISESSAFYFLITVTWRRK